MIILIGAVLFAVSTGKIARNECQAKNVNDPMFHKSDLCDKYFLDSNKYVAVILGLIEGTYFICLACLLDNMKLFGLKTGPMAFRRRDQASAEADVEAEGASAGGSGRRSVARSTGRRRSSLARKKGIGSFGAITSNMTNNSSSKLARASSTPAPRSRVTVIPRKDKDNDKDASS